MMRRLAEWWLIRLGAPSDLVGDLCEAAAHRPAWWYWRQAGATSVVLIRRAVARQPWLWLRVGAIAVGMAVLLGSVVSRATVGPVDALDVHVEASGWLPMPAPDGQVRVIPAVVVRVANQTPHRLAGVQLNVIFRRALDGTEWDSVWKPRVGGRRLAPGAHAEALVIASQHGHIGTQEPIQLLRHPEFVDVRVELYAKYGAQAWTRLAVHQVPRRLAHPVVRPGTAPVRMARLGNGM